MAAELRFRVMGSDAHLVVVGGAPGLVGDAKLRIEELERRWSRFIDESEVSELNRRAGGFVRVSPDTHALVERAVDAWRLSGGACDPIVLGAMIRSGYDRSFEHLGPSPAGGRSLLGVGAADIVMADGSIRLPAGTGFDPGGIGKGLAGDLVCAELLEAGAEGACVNLGGDVRVVGAGPAGGPWTIAVEHPWAAEPIALLGLVDGAVATSTTLRRRWHTDGEARHHLIDPQTGQPSDTDLALATVVAGDGWVAEALAKAVLLAGSVHPFDIVGGTGAEAVAVDEGGTTFSTAGLDSYLGGAPLPPRLVPPRVTTA